MKGRTKKVFFSIERATARCLGFVLRPIPLAAKWTFVFLAFLSKKSPWISVLMAPFFLELGRVGLDRNGSLVIPHQLITGAKIYIDLAEKNQRGLYSSTVYEEGLTRFVIANLKAGDVFVDVGANVGYYTLIAASLGARVVAIEPDDENLALLRQNIALNKYAGIKILDVAVGDHEGTATLHVNPLNRGGNSLIGRDRYFSESHGYSRTEIERMYGAAVLEKEVRLTTMDSVAKEQRLTSIAILKIDVEEFEEQVIEGMKNMISSGIARHIVCELGNKETRDELMTLFTKAGYRYYSANQEGKPLKGILGRDVIFTKV